MSANYKLKHTFAALPRTVRARRLCIKGDPTGKYMLYTHGKGVIIRSVENPLDTELYVVHTQDVGAACYSPNGSVIASGDKNGNVQFWNTESKEAKKLKSKDDTLGVIGGEVKDICWDSESKRVGVCGVGGCNARVIFYESRSNVCQLKGHLKAVNAINFKYSKESKQCCLLTASEDFTVRYLKGPSFENATPGCHTEHTNFCNIARFSPDEKRYISGSSDGTLFLYDTATNAMIKQIVDADAGLTKAYTGGIYDLAWGPDNKHVLTVSAGDKVAKIFDVDENKCTMVFTFGGQLENQQLACAWIGDQLITVDLAGYINYLDRDNPSKPKKIIKGHNKNITSLAVSEDKKKIYTGSYDGHIYVWDTATGICEPLEGTRHTNQVSRLAVSGSDLYTISMDDSFMIASTETDAYSGDSVSFDAEPKSLSAGKDGLALVACVNETVCVIRNGKKMSSKKFEDEVSAVAVHPNQTEVAIANKTKPEVYIYSLDGDFIGELQHTVPTVREASVMQYSPDGTLLGVGLADKNVKVFKTTEEYKRLNSGFTNHSSRITCLAWRSDSAYLATGSLDTNIFVWPMDKKLKFIEIKAAHKNAPIAGVDWLSDGQLVSTASDCCVKIWDLTLVG